MPTFDENVQIARHDLILEDGSGKEVARLAATLFAGASGADPGTACRIVIRDDAGVTRIDLDGSDPDIKLMGVDLAEDFDGPAALAPGTVVVAVGPRRWRRPTRFSTAGWSASPPVRATFSPPTRRRLGKA